MRRRRSVLLAAALPLLAALGGCFSNVDNLDLSNAAVHARVEERLHSHPDFDLHLVDIDVSNQTVVISGIVSTWQAKEAIGRAVSRTPGVREVLNNLLVEERP